MGPLALMAQEAGLTVFGSDLAAGAVTSELVAHGIKLYLGEQDGEFLRARAKDEGVDWFVYTSALPADHPELVLARRLGLKISKRDELLNYLIEKLDLKLVAVAGTHGKTTTTAMIVWGAQKLGLPLSYLIGTTLPFAEAGHYDPEADYFVYEADEYDRNFLAFHPWLAAIPTVTYDHPDIYPTVEDYRAAFRQFEEQSETVLHGDEIDSGLTLAGEARRYDATLAIDVLERLLPKARGAKGVKGRGAKAAEVAKKRFWTPGVVAARQRHRELVRVMNEFPGVGRRFEQVSEGYYSDYAHHPEEVAATVEVAIEEAERRGLKGVVALYEPHQNTRQSELAEEYAEAFQGVTHLYWLPTYLTRENPALKVLEPEDFIAKLTNRKVAEAAELDEALAEAVQKWHAEGYLILLMTAGPADGWLRKLVYAGNQQSAATQLVHAPRSAAEGSERE